MIRKHVKRHAAHAKRVLKDHFIPHEGNDHHPHALRHRMLFFYSGLLITIKVVAVLLPVGLPSSSLYASAVTPKNIIALTNQTRKNLELPVLKMNDLLSKAAAAKAADMAQREYFAHKSPDGRTPWDWIKAVGYTYRFAGENLAVQFEQAEDVEAGWLASPMHRANIVNADYTEIGVGVATGRYKNAPAIYVVQMFGQPESVVAANAPVAPPVEIPVLPPAVSANDGTVAGTNNTALQISTDNVVVQPVRNGYQIKAEVPGAESVAAALGDQHIRLIKSDVSTWVGLLPLSVADQTTNGESLRLTATRAGSEPVIAAVALVGPQVQTQKFFTFQEGKDRYAQFFGGLLTVRNLDDNVRQFYIAFIVLLIAGFIFNAFFVKLRAKHPSVLAHTAAVICLAGFLLVV